MREGQERRAGGNERMREETVLANPRGGKYTRAVRIPTLGKKDELTWQIPSCCPILNCRNDSVGVWPKCETGKRERV